MEYQFKELRKEDIKTISSYAIVGMHFNQFFSNKFLLNLVGRYFFISQLNRATQVVAAYQGDNLAGVLLAEMKGESSYKGPWYRQVFIRTMDWLSSLIGKDGVDNYELANRELLDEYKQDNNHYDGEICFLAADPNTQAKGIGTALLNELTKRESGKKVIVYTDTSCTYQFYNHRGFKLEGSKKIMINFSSHTNSLECYLYSKIL